MVLGDNRIEIATMLLEAGAHVRDHGRLYSDKNLMLDFYIRDDLDMVKLLSSWSAPRFREFKAAYTVVEEEKESSVLGDRWSWVFTSRKWTTPLHHLTIIPATRARALLRKGASIHAASALRDPTPISLARELHTKGEAAEGSAAALVLKAAAPWTRSSHELFPVTARAFAVQMMLIGHRLSRLPKYEAEPQAVFDLWVDHVMPHMVGPRESE